MPSLQDSLKQIFSVLDTFLTVTLNYENLGKVAEKERAKLTSLLTKLYADHSDLNPKPNLNNTKKAARLSRDDSRASDGSSTSSQPDVFKDDTPGDFAPTTVKALTNPTKIGYLQMKSTGSKQKPYCVIHRHVFYWFAKPTDRQQEGAISLKDYEFKTYEKKIAKKSFMFDLVYPGRIPHQFVADTKDDLLLWKTACDTANAVVVDSPQQEEEYGMEYTDLTDAPVVSKRVDSEVRKYQNIPNASKDLTSPKSPPTRPVPPPFASGRASTTVTANDDGDGIPYEDVDGLRRKQLQGKAPRQLPSLPSSGTSTGTGTGTSNKSSVDDSDRFYSTAESAQDADDIYESFGAQDEIYENLDTFHR